MKWYSLVESEPESQVIQREGELSTRRLYAADDENVLSLISQFFIATQVLFSSKAPSMPPVPNECALVLFEKHIVPHYERCIVFYQGGEIIGSNASKLKPTSREKFEDTLRTGMLNPLLTELYQENAAPPDLSVYKERPVIYKLERDSLCGEIVEAEELENYVRETYFKSEGHFSVIPVGWVFGEHLLQSVYLKFLSTFCSDIYLYVWPSDGTVICVAGHR